MDGDSSNESLYKVTMEDGSRPVFIMGDEEGKLSSTCTQGVSNQSVQSSVCSRKWQ